LPQQTFTQLTPTPSLDSYCESAGTHVIVMVEAIICNVNHLSKTAI